MKTLWALGVAAALAGCGVETATTAGSAATIKKQEVEQGQRTMRHAQEKIGGAMQQAQDRAQGIDK